MHAVEAARMHRNRNVSVKYRRPAKCGCEGDNRYLTMLAVLELQFHRGMASWNEGSPYLL